MQDKVASTKKAVIILAHTLNIYNESDMVMECKVPVKGALKNQGIESYFSTVVSAQKVPVKKLKDFENKYLTITPAEERQGFKHVFQCNPGASDRIRAPMGMFEYEETYIDNNAQFLINILNDYYDEG